MKRYIDLSVTVHRRGPGFGQVSSVHQGLHTGAHIDSPLRVFRGTASPPPSGLDHGDILGAGLITMEGLTNRSALSKRRVDFAAAFYRLAGTEGAPARFFATVD